MAEQLRPPVVTILGHVDHGKTTLLDFIRKTAVAAKEAGGITQAIGAYQLQSKDGLITFIDTPGHAAFEKMRSRGASVADISVLVVAVDDGVMPQTVEAIKHIKDAGTPMIIAVNKVDLLSNFPSDKSERKIDYSHPQLKIALDKIKKQLSDQEVLVEEYGGDVPIVQLSAKTGQGVPELLETIGLIAEIHEFKGNTALAAVGVVIESRIDKFKGPIATLLVRDGSLQKGDLMVVGEVSGKVRGMFDWNGKNVDLAGPSMPVEVLGFQAVPAVGAKLGEITSQSAPSGVNETKVSSTNEKVFSLLDKLKENNSKVLSVVVKADKQGSLEAVETILQKFNEEEQHIKILSVGTGDIVDSDINLATSAQTIVLGFNVAVSPSAAKLAEVEHVLVRTYTIIYEMIDELTEVVEGMLKPGALEEVFGRAQIIAEFPFGKGERIAGSKIVEGSLAKGPKARVVRGEEVVGEGRIKSIRKVKEEVNRVEKGGECGILFDNPIDFKIGDMVETYRTF